jgi:hypothetical protein
MKHVNLIQNNNENDRAMGMGIGSGWKLFKNVLLYFWVFDS